MALGRELSDVCVFEDGGTLALHRSNLLQCHAVATAYHVSTDGGTSSLRNDDNRLPRILQEFNSPGAR